MFVKLLTLSLSGWVAGASVLATTEPTDIWDVVYRIVCIALGVAAGTMSRFSTWVIEVEGEDGKKRKVIDRSLMGRDLFSSGTYFVGGFTAGAATGWMPELIGFLTMCFATVGIVATRRLLFDGLGAVLQNLAARPPSSTKIDGDAP